MRVCIVDKVTKECVKVILLDSLDEYIEEEGLELSTMHDGQVGWILNGDEWITLTPELTVEQLIERARSKRDKLLKTTVDKINPVQWSALSSEEQTAWIAYRQALLDIPQQKLFPTNIVWPDKP